MNSFFLQQAVDAAAANRWAAIMPEIMLGLTALALLVLELVLPKKHHDVIAHVSIAAQVGIATALYVNFRAYIGIESFNGLLRHTAVGQFLRLFFLAASVLASFLGMIALGKRRLPRVEFFHLVLVVTAAMMLLAQSNHFVMLFMALETVAIGFYVLIGYFRDQPLSLEASLKYLVLSGLSSAILLFGVMLLYGVAGNPVLPGATANALHFGALRSFLELNAGNSVANVGVAFVLCGVAFKIGAVPFHIWVPDVYQGAPTPVTAFLAVGSKAAGFAVLLVLTQMVFSPCQSLIVPLLGAVAGATIIFGNLAALTQHNVKRLMGLSGVAHAGYLLIGVIAALTQPLALGAIFFYLTAYLLGAMAVFGVMTHLAGEADADQELDHYVDLAKTRPFLGVVLAVGLGSLAGLPPLAGFIGKLLIFVAAFKAGLYPLLVVAVAGVIVSIYYYFGWIKAAFFAAWRTPLADGEPSPERTFAPVGIATGFVLGALAFGSILLGCYQGSFGLWMISQ